MEKTAQEAAKILDQTEQELLKAVAPKEPIYSGLEALLAKFRDAAQNIFVFDIQAAWALKAELRLWNAHGRVNAKFRSHLATLRERSAKKKFVERRKAEDYYTTFLKSSISFYRGFICRLAARFQDVSEVFEIAKKFGENPLSANPAGKLDAQQKGQLIRSCHASLIHLGDLSRYRETEVPKQAENRNWGPAIGYYDLANALLPHDGQSFNQRAVIALAGNDHLRAVYFLYRALTVLEPTENAKSNLEIEFKKISTKHAKGEFMSTLTSSSGNLQLEASFLVLHARAYAQPVFDDCREQCTGFVTRFAEALKQNSLGPVAKKICLINISASCHAESYVIDAIKNDSALLTHRLTVCARLQTLNVLTFIVLLRLLSGELASVVGEGVGEMDEASCIARVTPLCRQVLPCLRLYSLWLISKVKSLMEMNDGQVGTTGATSLPDLPHLWQRYALTLSTLIKAFPIRSLPQAAYLLDEDQEIIASTAFEDFAKDHVFGSLSSRLDIETSQVQPPELEMLVRVMQMVVDGLFLLKKHPLSARIPLHFAENQLMYIGSDASEGLLDPQQSSSPSISSAVVHETKTLFNAAGIAKIPSSNIRDFNGCTAANVAISMPPVPPTDSRRPSSASTSSPSSAVSRPTSKQLTAADLFRQIQGQSPAPPSASLFLTAHRAPAPAPLQSPLTPIPNGRLASLPTSTTPKHISDAATPLPSARSPTLSTANFEQQIAQMQHNIQNRSSPNRGFDPTITPASYYQTPTVFDTFIRQNVSRPSQSSPWVSSLESSVASGEEVPREIERASPYGAIGDARPRSGNAGKTPTSGQAN